jgi:hypothetical protein
MVRAIERSDSATKACDLVKAKMNQRVSYNAHEEADTEYIQFGAMHSKKHYQAIQIDTASYKDTGHVVVDTAF